MTDTWTIIWKEWQELLSLGGGKRGALLRAFFSIGLLGVIWPWLLGAPFISSVLPVLFAAMTSTMYVSALVPDSFPGERERHTLETLLASRLPDAAILYGKVAAVMLYGISASAVILAVGWITVNLKEAGPLLLYRPGVLMAAALFAVLGSGFMAALGTVVALRAATVKQAQQVLTTGLMFLFIAPALLAEAWPRGWTWLVESLSGNAASGSALRIALGLAIGQIILFAIAHSRFKRNRLLIDSK